MDADLKKQFEDQEQELKDSTDVSELCVGYWQLAEEVNYEGDTDWAKSLYKEALACVEFGIEWWDNFRNIDTDFLEPQEVQTLIDKWELCVRENRGNLGYVEKDELYEDLLIYVEKKTGDEDRISRITSEQESAFTISDLEGPFGTSRQGDGKIVYLFANELDTSAVDMVVGTHYHRFIRNEDGDIVRDWAEYDPSQLETAIGAIEDEVSFGEIVSKLGGDSSGDEQSKFSVRSLFGLGSKGSQGGSSSDQFKNFLRDEILENRIPLIFIDNEERTITQLGDYEIDSVVDQHGESLHIYIREYDSAGDY